VIGGIVNKMGDKVIFCILILMFSFIFYSYLVGSKVIGEPCSGEIKH
jgi:hypothetical protein